MSIGFLEMVIFTLFLLADKSDRIFFTISKSFLLHSMTTSAEPSLCALSSIIRFKRSLYSFSLHAEPSFCFALAKISLIADSIRSSSLFLAVRRLDPIICLFRFSACFFADCITASFSTAVLCEKHQDYLKPLLEPSLFEQLTQIHFE